MTRQTCALLFATLAVIGVACFVTATKLYFTSDYFQPALFAGVGGSLVGLIGLGSMCLFHSRRRLAQQPVRRH